MEEDQDQGVLDQVSQKAEKEKGDVNMESDITKITLRDTARVFKLNQNTLAIGIKTAIKRPLDLKVGDYLDVTFRKTGICVPNLGTSKGRTKEDIQQEKKNEEDGTTQLDEDSI